MNLALTRPLPSTALRTCESQHRSAGTLGGVLGQQLRQAPGGLGRRRGGTGVIEQAQLPGRRCGAGRVLSLWGGCHGAIVCQHCPRGCGRSRGRGGSVGWSGAPLCTAERGAPPQPSPTSAHGGAVVAAWVFVQAWFSPHPGPGSSPAGEGKALGPRPDSPGLRPTALTPPREGQLLCGWVPPATAPGCCPLSCTPFPTSSQRAPPPLSA